MPEDARSNENVFPLFKTCLASLAFHKQFCNDNLHHRSAVVVSPFYSEPVPYADHVVTRYPWNFTEDTPNFTGLPVDVLYMEKLERLRLEVVELKDAMMLDHNRIIEELSKSIEESLDKRSIGGCAYVQIAELMSKLDVLLEKLNNPVVPPQTAIDEQTAIAGIIELNCDVVEEEDVVVTVEENAAFQQKTIREKSKQQMEKRRYRVGYYDGRWNTLPKGWEYPEKMNLIQMITLFQMGNPAESIPPLKTLTPQDVKRFDAQGNNLSRMKRFMLAVKHFAILRGVWKPINAQNYWNGATVTNLWDGVWDDLMPYLLTKTQLKTGKVSYHKSRVSSLAWRTCHDKLGAGREALFERLKI
jgi:hypothetical protein